VLESKKPPNTTNGSILKIERLKVHFPIERTILDTVLAKPIKVVKAVDDVSLDIREDEVIGLVGETGCGKSTIAKTILLMHPITSGEIIFEGTPIRSLSKDRRTGYFSKVQMVWQDPFSCLNPRMRVNDILSRPLLNFKRMGKREIRERMRELIRIVGLNENELSRYPHEFSGGGRQRIVIARALISEPTFLIADEPTSSLDVSIQAQILNLLKKLKDKYHFTMLFISHDLAVINFISNKVAVMYFGRVVEFMPKDHLLSKNFHWYTKSLIAAIPRGRRKIYASVSEERNYELNYDGCIYYHRCENAQEKCLSVVPDLKEYESHHFAACHYPNRP